MSVISQIETQQIPETQEQTKTVNEQIKELTDRFKALNRLHEAFGKAGGKASLEFPHPKDSATPFKITKKELKESDREFERDLKTLVISSKKNSKRKKRSTVRPEDFTGAYAPVYASEALRFFINKAQRNFGSVIDPSTGKSVDLMSLLPRVREGYMLHNTVTILFYIYIWAQKLQDEKNRQFITPDAHWEQAFGKNISAAFFTMDHPETGKKVKYLMSEAVGDGIITSPMNTYKVLEINYKPKKDKEEKYPGFSKSHFNTYMLKPTSSLNFYTKSTKHPDELERQIQLLEDLEIRREMLKEHDIVKRTSKLWKERIDEQNPKKAAKAN